MLTDSQPLLEVHDIHAGYVTGQDILNGVTVAVHKGEIVCVIGPNGAGKSTVFKAVYGFLPVRSGRVLFDDREITNVRPQDALKAGITIVPQLHSVFPDMTVYEIWRWACTWRPTRSGCKNASTTYSTCFHVWPSAPNRPPAP